MRSCVLFNKLYDDKIKHEIGKTSRTHGTVDIHVKFLLGDVTGRQCLGARL
jgi:hypothetical protein